MFLQYFPREVDGSGHSFLKKSIRNYGQGRSSNLEGQRPRLHLQKRLLPQPSQVDHNQEGSSCRFLVHGGEVKSLTSNCPRHQDPLHDSWCICMKERLLWSFPRRFGEKCNVLRSYYLEQYEPIDVSWFIFTEGESGREIHLEHF